MKTTETICPLCKENNACGIEEARECWCMQTSIPIALLNKVPDTQVNQVCICANCITKYNTKQHS